MDHYLFDMDGTLTDPRQPIDREFKEIFLNFCTRYSCHVVTGSDLPKVREQLGTEVMNTLSTVFACGGNIAYYAGREIWRSEAADWRLTDEQIHELTKILDSSDFWLRTGNHIEQRIGSANFSIVGRNADTKARGYYKFWDEAHGEREKIVKLLRKNKTMKKLDFMIGGETGIDIYPRGFSKVQVRKLLIGRVFFIGDRCEPGGNDYDIATACTVHAQVKNWQETQKMLTKMAWS